MKAAELHRSDIFMIDASLSPEKPPLFRRCFPVPARPVRRAYRLGRAPRLARLWRKIELHSIAECMPEFN